jgi:hypothetical protein|tara:strand:+ start:649 stop:933 length:285 start_codon:yes stop_codon:yes gene_type:complete
MSTKNYQQIYEEELTMQLKEPLGFPERFFELSDVQQRLVEELVDQGYRAALEEALDPEVLEETAELAGEMGAQLYNFANMISGHLRTDGPRKEV